jgi:hypothetical protein
MFVKNAAATGHDADVPAITAVTPEGDFASGIRTKKFNPTTDKSG